MRNGSGAQVPVHGCDRNPNRLTGPDVTAPAIPVSRLRSDITQETSKTGGDVGHLAFGPWLDERWLRLSPSKPKTQPATSGCERESRTPAVRNTLPEAGDSSPRSTPVGDPPEHEGTKRWVCIRHRRAGGNPIACGAALRHVSMAIENVPLVATENVPLGGGDEPSVRRHLLAA